MALAGKSRVYHGDGAPACEELGGGEPDSERARPSSHIEVVRCCCACGSWSHSLCVIRWCNAVWIVERTSTARYKRVSKLVRYQRSRTDEDVTSLDGYYPRKEARYDPNGL